MSSILLNFGDSSIDLACRAIKGHERLGKEIVLEIEGVSAEPVRAEQVVGKVCSIAMGLSTGQRTIYGTVMRFAAQATAHQDNARQYRLVVKSSTALLGLRRMTRVFQDATAPDIIKDVLTSSIWEAGDIVDKATATTTKLEYVVQYEETDEAFIRRMCEEYGLYYRFEAPAGENEKFVLEDTSSGAPSLLDGPLSIVDEAGLHIDAMVAHDVHVQRKRRPGRVAMRDYDRLNPALELEGEHEQGTDVEKGTEVYVAPGGFKTKSDGAKRAQLYLESVRALATVIRFETTAMALAAGTMVTLEQGVGFNGTVYPTGDYFIVAVEHQWQHGDDKHRVVVEAIPKDVPYRLARVTPRPKINGVHEATVTGASGEEIHPDENGCIYVRFAWDRLGPTDDKSSLPVRVSQPNMPGSMVIPRVGWEVAVAFEDGDPDRPYVLGRVYNSKTPPPVALPANKTMTSMQSFSSPGGGTHNTITFDDAAGRQHMNVYAGYDKNSDVANNMMSQVANVERRTIKVDQTCSVGADENVDVTEALIVNVGDQTASVGSQQSIFVKGDFKIKVDTEAVLVGGALLEKVGNPVAGLVNLGVAGLLAGAGQLGEGLTNKWAKGALDWGGKLAGLGYNAFKAQTADGAVEGAWWQSGLSGMVGIGAGMLPGGGQLLNTITGAGAKYPWETDPPPPGEQQQGGGAGGTKSDSSFAAELSKGHRNEKVTGAMAEAIGAGKVVLTPGEIKWELTGGSLVGVGASHSTSAKKIEYKQAGLSTETLGSYHIKTTGDTGREVKGNVKTGIGGKLKMKAGGQATFEADAKLTLDVGGTLDLKGSFVGFGVGNSILLAHSGGVVCIASTIKFKKATKQSKKATH